MKTWVHDKPCAFPGCIALVSGWDVRYCPTHDDIMCKSWGVDREIAIAKSYTKRKRKHGKMESR